MNRLALWISKLNHNCSDATMSCTFWRNDIISVATLRKQISACKNMVHIVSTVHDFHSAKKLSTLQEINLNPKNYLEI